MLAKILSGAVVGLDAIPVTVEVDISSKSLPSFTIVGLPDKAVEESKERVRSAIKNSGAEFPNHRITVNLAPADLPKIGPAYDLPIALGMLIASGQLAPVADGALFVGELSLDGGLRHTNGILPLALMGRDHMLADTLYVPAPDAKEASVIKGLRIISVPTLLALFRHLSKSETLPVCPHTPFSEVSIPQGFEFDFADVAGQEHVKRVLEIAAAGGHNVFMQGPPGAGKTMLARTLPSILPAMTEEEAIEVTKVYSVTGNLSQGESLVKYRPFRSPHHTTSRIGLIGGGTRPMPGEISLAHRGVLFLDEFPEYPRHVLEALRQPVEDGIVTISRAVGTMRYPAKFMLVAAANPCPCGNFHSVARPCSCLPGMVARYQKRISGPLIDRIDLHVQVPVVPSHKLGIDMAPAEPSKAVQKRVQRARDIQTKRFAGTKVTCNGEMSTKLVREYCVLPSDVGDFLRQAVAKMGLSARSYYRILKVSRTISDLAGATHIRLQHVAEALQYRPHEV
ncbi:YifB family Mg chelatase-like AAA ATPase [Patescibacteria group bacterium]|nr:YifB family Mg chelatase-like AAA ATPase [Patescibacteria group bacterium]